MPVPAAQVEAIYYTHVQEVGLGLVIAVWAALMCGWTFVSSMVEEVPTGTCVFPEMCRPQPCVVGTVTNTFPCTCARFNQTVCGDYQTRLTYDAHAVFLAIVFLGVFESVLLGMFLYDKLPFFYHFHVHRRLYHGRA